MKMTAHWGSWDAAASDEWIDGFMLDEVRLLRRTLTLTPGVPFPPVHMCVEVRRLTGGLMPIALLGAELRFSNSVQLTLEIPTSGDIRPNGQRQPGLLGLTLVPGLPDQFADAIVRGMTARTTLPAGILRVRQAGDDPVDSSSMAFERAATLLARMLIEQARGVAVTSELLRRALRDLK